MNRRRSRSKKYRERSRDIGSWIWLIAIPVAVVALMMFGAAQSGAFVKVPEPSRNEDPADLLPLSNAGQPIYGGHDTSLIPERPPTPREALAGESTSQLDIPSASYNFGQIYDTWDVTHIFAVQNTGDADLLIGNLVTSCGCTTAELSSNVVPPGQRADLTVTFDADYHPTNGPVSRLVWFATNDPIQPWVEMRITADVQ
ncbi:MAG TPA: DUF1573 domain-containing protein [Chloroflexi bacterium]|nr:DUF1573 domain-containing protein [Chloroflexota bacterium]